MHHREFPEARILIVDDDPNVVTLLTQILAFGGLRRVKSETDSTRAQATFNEFRPDLVILDLHMAPLDGMEVLALLRPSMSDGEYLPIVMITGDVAREAKELALSEGAMDFITKPISAGETLLRIKNLLRARQLYVELHKQRDQLDERVRERTNELQEARNEILERLGFLAEFRDDATGLHTKRVSEMVRKIALEMLVPGEEAELMGKAAQLHDIGKVGIPDEILLKPGGLTEQEFSKMKKHSQIGGDILRDSKSSLLQLAETIARFHHERWNGAGYEGLAGEAIPLEARIAAVSDVFDALVTDRPYKQAWKWKAALSEIKRLSGTYFDPIVVEAFFRVVEADDTLKSVTRQRKLFHPEIGRKHGSS